MSSVPKHDVGIRTVASVVRSLSNRRWVRRQTPLVPAAEADLDLCRSLENAPPVSITRRMSATSIAGLSDEFRASIQSAYRPKPRSGGAYSLARPEEEKLSAKPGVMTRKRG